MEFRELETKKFRNIYFLGRAEKGAQNRKEKTRLDRIEITNKKYPTRNIHGVSIDKC